MFLCLNFEPDIEDERNEKTFRINRRGFKEIV